MSRPERESYGWFSCFPRVSGDEPHLSEFTQLERVFSPRERG